MSTQQNHLIEQLPRRERERLLAVAEPVKLVLAEAICESGTPARHVYFPVDGFISLLTSVDVHPSLEVGMVGREGMLGVWLALGVPDTPLRAIVQGSGSAWRIAALPFRRELERSPALRRSLERYLYVLMAQFAASAACLRFHRIEPRLARWLLMTQDRAHADRFHVTHEFLAYMLGVRRVGVTMAAGALQERGQIAYHRGELVVLDRAGLEDSACSCYAADRRVYAAVMG
ncbi:Crp/Fnr family transcriptional regulator [uncultured Piscinibacter sp.]|uniref:Crp/Fnr family transcriptional regulator n=1 Tax=uncultured Piscinibacter sp. TaxID=1131835 RepID=UPI00262C9EB3|nr:Crp/Fnr family transcriptional regulator [uncultured Piscinibacter sp.]